MNGMNYIVIDLEWNGSWSKKAHGYFNEIIEIGAVKLDEKLTEQGVFHAVIKPQVSKKLSTIVTDLTNITDEELAQKLDNARAAAAQKVLEKDRAVAERFNAEV